MTEHTFAIGMPVAWDMTTGEHTGTITRPLTTGWEVYDDRVCKLFSFSSLTHKSRGRDRRLAELRPRLLLAHLTDRQRAALIQWAADHGPCWTTPLNVAQVMIDTPPWAIKGDWAALVEAHEAHGPLFHLKIQPEVDAAVAGMAPADADLRSQLKALALRLGLEAQILPITGYDRSYHAYGRLNGFPAYWSFTLPDCYRGAVDLEAAMIGLAAEIRKKPAMQSKWRKTMGGPTVVELLRMTREDTP